MRSRLSRVRVAVIEQQFKFSQTRGDAAVSIRSHRIQSGRSRVVLSLLNLERDRLAVAKRVTYGAYERPCQSPALPRRQEEASTSTR